MKNTVKLLAMVLVFGSANAFAEGVIVDGRMDYNSINNNDAAIAAGKSNTSAFKATRLRLLVQSKIKEDLMGKVRLNLLESSNAPVGESGYSKFIDYAFVTQTFTPNFALSFGRVINYIGGREAITGSGDYYFVSQAGAQVVGRPTSAQYPVGMVLTGMLADQRLDVVAANSTIDDGTNQTRMLVGASYLGSFLDKTLMPIASYYTDTDNENNSKRTYINVGLKYLITPMFDLEADYLMNNADYNNWTAAASKDTTSIVASLRVKTSDYFHVVVKAESSTDKVAAGAGANPAFDDNKIAQYGVAAEYYPYTAETNMRYHLAAVQRTTKPGAGGDDQVETKLYAGVRFVADFLK